jgi:hypothetical protein
MSRRSGVLLALSLPAVVAAVGAAVAFSGEDRTPSDTTQAGSVRDVGIVLQHHRHRHAGASGHLQATRSNVELVSTLKLQRAPRKRIADVAVHGGYAYLGSWGGGTCRDNGVHVVDLRDPARPRKVAFIPAPQGSVPGEGVQALHIDTAHFDGNVVVTNNETCDSRRRTGGLNLYDVSNPRRPRTLVEGFGDRSSPRRAREAAAHEIHSVFVWDAGQRAYAVLVDNREPRDVDIADITNPRKPVLVAEYDLRTRFERITQARPSNLTDVFHHDVVVKRIGSRQIMLVSYWDGGYVKLDVTNPRKARYLADSDLPSLDPELLEQAGLREAPEGNAHQAEFTAANDFIIAADEDFGPTGIEARTDDGGSFVAPPGSRTPEVEVGTSLAGGTRYVGRACDADAPVPAASGATFAVVSRGVCPFTAKLANVQPKGYEAVIVVNAEGPEGCGVFRMAVEGGIPAFSVERAVGLGLFDRRFDGEACRRGSEQLLPEVPIGATGDRVTIRAFFDGWGYVHLFRNGNGKLDQLDTYAIPEAMNPAFAKRRGDLTVHEVATSLERNDLAYFSYYAGGFRVLRIEDDRLVEAGRFIDVAGNNLWGVQVFTHEGREYVAASDIDFGLYVFRYTGS